MQEKIKLIEEKALRQERLMQQNTAGSLSQYSYSYNHNEVNDMLIDAIKAKLAMLDQIK